MKKRKWLIPILIIAVIFALIAACLIIMLVKGIGMSVGRYLVTKNGESLVVMYNSPIVMSNRTKSDLFEGFDIGDKIIFIHDGIAESYPGKTGVYAVFKLGGGDVGDISKDVLESLSSLGWLSSDYNADALFYDDDAIDHTLSYAGYTDSEKIYDSALNADKFGKGSAKRLPIYKFDTMDDLEQFKSDFGDILTMNDGYNKVPAFNESISEYDDAFFDKNTLILVYVPANSGSYRFKADSIFCDGAYLGVTVEQTNDPDNVTDDMAGWFINVSVSDSIVKNCTEFDAKIN